MNRTGARTSSFAACAMAFGLLATSAACGGDDSDEGGAIERGLRQIPMSVFEEATKSSAPFVQIADLVELGELNGLSAPEIGRSDDEIDEWVTGLTARDRDERSQVATDWNAEPSPAMIGPQAFVDEIGLDVGAIESFASVISRPLSFVAYTGDLVVSPSLDDLGGGVFTSGSGNDFEVDVDGGTDLRRLGSPLRLGERDDAMAMSTSTASIEAWLDDEADSLADDDRHLEVARALDRLEAPTALLFEGDFGNPGPSAERASVGVSSPFDILGIGGAAVDGEPSIIVVYHFGDPDQAESSVDSISSLWTDSVLNDDTPIGDLVDLVSVTADGATTTVVARTLDGLDTNLGERMLLGREVVFRYR